jgi:3-methyladenine DNA glycosylase/8-oxoguanine DNA glycosylase
LADIPGVGPWTIGSVLGPTMGDPDAFAVGDFWLKHIVCRALAGEARGTDERMVELLAPYDGQRGRVVALLRADGWRAERRGSGHRVLPMADW